MRMCSISRSVISRDGSATSNSSSTADTPVERMTSAASCAVGEVGRSRSQNCFQASLRWLSGCLIGSSTTTRCRAACQCFDEWSEISDVVHHVVTDSDITDWGLCRNFRPISEHRLNRNLSIGSLLSNDIEHALLVVDSNDVGCGRSKSKHPTPTTAADVEYRW